MRMWGVDPKMLCRQHLLGEHCEMHMFVGTIQRKKSIKGYLAKGQVEVHRIVARHAELAREMLRRGMNHKSSLPEFESWEAGKVDREDNVKELCRRCERCKERYEDIKNERSG